MNLFSLDSPLMRALNLIADLVILHLLWVLCSIPIFTMGASTTALYYACMKRVRTKEGYITRNFFHSFKENFRQSTIVWLVLLVIGFLYVTNIRYGIFLDNTMGKVIIVGCSIFLIPYLLIAMYIFPVQAKFENPVIGNVKNALIMALRHFHYSLLLFFIWGSFFLMTRFSVPFMGLALICGAGLMGWLTSMIFIQIFRKYIPDEIEEDLEKSGEKFI
ncbi:MAG TPA: YesL family protein [Candidatus Pelethocola excrementipullorum]|nr:YesL family protein [Candidatus Pelethocola excrementipullorum]